jgi:hypothetical protein
VADVSAKRSIFFDEWQACLRAHYKTVIQQNDTITEPTLRGVLLQSGLTEDELRALAEEALTGAPLQASDPHSAEEYPGESPHKPADGQMALF